jgi:predicted nucleotide-binding protein (sugar kinase/HSP70/actin superfamily)
MAYAGSRLIVAAFHSVGIDATVSPDSDAETLELAGLHASGEECLPHKVTLGDFLKVCRQPDFEPERTAFFMATAHGPCRFGQYVPYLRKELDALGYHDALIVSPSSENGYEALGEHAAEMVRTAWMALICGDVVLKCLLKTRPYETNPGDSDAAFERSIRDFTAVVSRPGTRPKQRLKELVGAVEAMRDRFRAIPANYVKGRPLIGLVGEIFCRMNDFSNDDTARRIERLGGECWISDIAEWVWYTNWGQGNTIVEQKGRLNSCYLKYRIKTAIQRQYEHALLAPLHDDFKGYEEPHDIREVLDAARPYLPPEGCLGEMVLSVGKSIYLHGKGADGIIDISPFTCMNGIVCEAVYPALSETFDDLPIRTLYFDGVNTNIDRDVEIFLDLARAYQKRKNHPRVYPDYFTG